MIKENCIDRVPFLDLNIDSQVCINSNIHQGRTLYISG